MSDLVDVFGLTDVGKVREENEDQFLVASLQKSMHLRQASLRDTTVLDRLAGSGAELFVVADGVGGAAGGRWASGTAVESLVEHLVQASGVYYNYDVALEQEFLDHLQHAIERAHEIVKGDSAPGAHGPATTLTMVTLIWPRAYVVHVGDSRAYWLRKGKLQQVTRDQTMAEQMVDEGVMSAEQAEREGLDHVLTSAVGGTMSPAIGLIDVSPGDVLMLCTDGLTKHVGDGAIAEILKRDQDAETSCRELLQAALDDGGTDNVSIIVARMLHD